MAAYASDLDMLIEDRQPRLWIHGHVHQALDRTIGVTRVVCNPLGYNTYRGSDLVAELNPALVVDI